MKILLVAHACHPDWGSESSVGWKVLGLLAQKHEVCLLTAERNRQGIEKASQDGRLSADVQFHFAAEPLELSANPLLAKLQEWPYYKSFLKAALPVAKQLHQENRFDLVHHVTFAAWRMGAPFWRLGIPQVFGPVGGGEQFDFRFLSLLSPAAALFEAVRVVSNWRAARDPEVRLCMKNSARVLVSNPETEAVALRLGATPDRLRRLMVVFFPQEILDKWKPAAPKPPGKLRMIAGGALEGRKGVALALRALAIAHRKGLDFEYHFTMGGPDAAAMKKLATSLGISSKVLFHDMLPRPEYEALVRSSHIYLLPSLRDNTPSALMEGMLAECVPVVADCGGPSLLVPDGTGIRIPLSKPEVFINTMAEKILELDVDRTRLQTLGKAAREWICSEFAQSTYAKRLEDAFDFALKTCRKPA